MRLRYIFAAVWFGATVGMLIGVTVSWVIEGRVTGVTFPRLLARYAIVLFWPLLMLVPKGRAMINQEVLQLWV